MASTTRTTNGTNLDASSVRNTYTNELRNQIQTGKKIRATHMNSLRDFVNTIRNHRHTLTEFSAVGNFGNLPLSNSNNRTTTIVKVGNNILGNLNVADRNSGTLIEESHHRILRDAVNGMRSHKHEFTDS